MDPQILKSKRLKEIVEISQSMLKGDYEKLRTNRMISVENLVLRQEKVPVKLKYFI